MTAVKEQLMSLDKEVLVDFILEAIPSSTIQERFWRNDEHRLERLRRRIDQAIERATNSEGTHDMLLRNHQETDTFNAVFNEIRIIYENIRVELEEVAATKPFYTLEVLAMLIQGLWQAEPQGDACDGDTEPIRALDSLATSILGTVGEKDSFTKKEEKVLLLIAKHFPSDRIKLFRDFGLMHNIELRSGVMAKAILARVREMAPVASSKRARFDTAQLIDMARTSS